MSCKHSTGELFVTVHCIIFFVFHRSFKVHLEKAIKGDLPYEVTQHLKRVSAANANEVNKSLKSSGQVCVIFGIFFCARITRSLSGHGPED